jgi:hypothetical protein
MCLHASHMCVGMRVCEWLLSCLCWDAVAHTCTHHMDGEEVWMHDIWLSHRSNVCGTTGHRSLICVCMHQAF